MTKQMGAEAPLVFLDCTFENKRRVRSITDLTSQQLRVDSQLLKPQPVQQRILGLETCSPNAKLLDKSVKQR